MIFLLSVMTSDARELVVKRFVLSLSEFFLSFNYREG